MQYRIIYCYFNKNDWLTGLKINAVLARARSSSLLFTVLLRVDFSFWLVIPIKVPGPWELVRAVEASGHISRKNEERLIIYMSI